MKAIAMKATQQDWDSVKDLVGRFIDLHCFKKYNYLVTNAQGKLGTITNIDRIGSSNFDRTVYETFDRAIFLDALDIVEENIWDGFELQFRDKDNGEWFNCSRLREYRLKPINLEVKQLQELADKLGYKIDKL